MHRTGLALTLLLAAAPAYAQARAARPAFDWRDGGVCYEVFVRSFFDSDGDGVGDLNGLTARLDYINDGDPESSDDLGASCIWLMPVAQSPSYHGYDVTNYYEVNREYGSNDDFRRFVEAAHQRGVRVLVDLVLNHMSSEHPIFKSVLLNTSSPYRDWFLWSPTQRRTTGWQATTWHRAGDREEYYYGLFWQGMPDLNLANPQVAAEWQRVARYWLEEMGVDGFRLDAVGHFFENGDEPRNGPGVHAWLREFTTALRQSRPDVFTVGEVWDSIGAVAHYYPDQLESYFAFQVSDALMGAVRTGEGAELLAAVQRVQSAYPAGRWASFQRNHDQTRTLTELGGDLRKARLSAGLLLTLPGLPFVYYGEELGMRGAKPDPRLRTPMSWQPVPAGGFTRGVPWEPLQPDSLTASVAVQDRDPGSLLSYYRSMVHLRGSVPALGATAEFIPLEASQPGTIAYLRRGEGETVLVVANLRDQPVSGVGLASGPGVLGTGRWRAVSLLGLGAGAELIAAADRRLSGALTRRLEPFGLDVLELTQY